MRILTLLLALFCSLAALAQQPRLNSPYSRYGLGDSYNQYFANQAGWGGQTAAYHDPFHLNLENPASLSFLRTTAFETGMFAKLGMYSSSTSSQNIWSGNLGYMALGFTLNSPINEVMDRTKSPWKFGMGASVAPYTLVGYNVETQNTVPEIGLVKNNFQGAGGTYKLSWAGSARYKYTSFGINTGWMYGKTNYLAVTTFADAASSNIDTFSSIFFQDYFRDDISVRGFVWKAGLQHDFILKTEDNDKDIPTEWITAGFTGESNHNISTFSDKLRLRSRGQQANGTFTDADTFINQTGLKRGLTLPARFSAALMYVKANKLKVGAQFGFDAWSGYVNEARPENFRNTVSASAGLEYIPDFISYNNYLKRARYRIGGYFRQDPRPVNGQYFNDIGVTLGLGLPLVLPRQQTSFINLAFEAGQIGAGSPIEELYFRVTAGFTLNDNTWFFKRRFE